MATPRMTSKLGAIIVLIASFLMIPTSHWAQEIRKRNYHGMAASPAADSILKRINEKQGVQVTRVVPTGTAHQAGVQAGDILLRVNQQVIRQQADLRAGALASVRAGDSVRYEVVRLQQRMILRTVSIGRPEEQASDIQYRYQSIPYGGGLLRAVLSTPRTASAEKLPAILFIQGYTCGEMVGLDTAHPYRRLTDGLTRAGYAVLRVEKPGVGDSERTPLCEDIDFQQECDAFEQALLHLRKQPEINTDQVFLWGHSLGGIITPVLTAKHQWIKGAIVYGTLSRIWGEYILHMTRIQSEGFGMPPVEIERTVRGVRKILYEIYTQGKSPIQFAAENPDLTELLQSQFMWEPGKDQLFTRSAKFNQTLDAVNPNELWSKTSAKVLAIYGEADIEALNPEATLSLVKTVNHYHPGNARYLFLKGTDHSFAQVGTIEDGYRTKADPAYSRIMVERFNPEVISVSVECLDGWLNRKPKVSATQTGPRWQKLKTDPYNGKQDDIFFIDEQRGWYVNGGGNIYKTTNGGTTWVKQFNKPGTFFRCIAFIDSLTGFAGNVGTDYFPNVQDTIPLYKTTDGGNSWTPVSYKGPYVKGLCAIDIVKEQYINHGKIDYRYYIYGVGRVGSPANQLISLDGGKTFTSRSLDASCKMLFDIKMFNKLEGFACAATSEDIATSNALILYTKDGGKTWEKRYQSARPFETTWKVAFPTRDTGYVTIQNYNPDKTVSKQRVAKTVDGGKTWFELDLCDDHNAREFGIGFIDAQHGYVGTMTSGYETRDGGKSWTKVNLGRACNKIRIQRDAEGKTYGYAIGVEVMKLVL